MLSGGGARGAYEAGVIAGITEILKKRGHRRAPFSIFTGTSVGAINATWLAAHADRPDMNVSGLLDQWRSLEIREHLRISPMRFLRPSRGGERLGRSFINPRALEELVRTQIPFGRLHDNIDTGVVQALVVAALNIANTKTTMFAEVSVSARLRAQFESDLLSFILFDGDFAEELISLGRHDARQRAGEVISFFSA